MIDKIFNEDCLEGMKRIPDGSVDMILTDPPFGITDAPFDNRIPFEPMWEQFKRVTKHNAAIVLFSPMPFGSDLIQSNRKMFRYEWIIHKQSAGGGFLNAKKMPLRVHENILVFYRALPTYNPQFTEGELVLDATIGSGSTAVAAINTGRHFIGFETEKRFCDIANERIEKALTERSQALF